MNVIYQQLTLQVLRRFFVAFCLLFMILALFVTYFSVILARRVSQQGQTVVVGILVSVFILILDLIAAKTINIMVSFEKHFSSAGRNWKRISYLAAFIICNSLAAILAYCASEPIALKSKSISEILQPLTLDETYEISYSEWFQSCSRTPYSSPLEVIARLSSLQNVDVRKTIGYWRHFTSQFIDGIPLPAFANELNLRTRDIKDPNIQIGCYSQKYLCESSATTTRVFSDSCAFISNISNIAAGSSVPEIVFSGAVYDLPWTNVSIHENGSKFRLNSFANEGSLYGFLFAFLLLKAARMFFYYVYNDFVSFVSRRLLLPLLKRQGCGTNVSRKHFSLFLVFSTLSFSCLHSNITHICVTDFTSICSMTLQFFYRICHCGIACLPSLKHLLKRPISPFKFFCL
jgi:hypothetical protein